MNQGWATAAQLAMGYGHIPAHVLPLFYAMMYGATLGGKRYDVRRIVEYRGRRNLRTRRTPTALRGIRTIWDSSDDRSTDRQRDLLKLRFLR